jgi:carbonic anhydrase/acetyltransferase-like protein (isoleucine patch superfamily)
VGSNSIILEGSIIEEGSVIGPNSVVPPGRIIPAHQLWAGNPVQYVRDISKAEITNINNVVRFDMRVIYTYIIYHL